MGKASVATGKACEIEDDDFDWLPPQLADIAGVIGLEAALRIAKLKGGARCYIPARAGEDHWLTSIVGRETANRLCAHYRVIPGSGTGLGVEITLPRGIHTLAKRRFYELRAQGVSVARAARECGAHLRTARRWEKDKGALKAARRRTGAIASPQLDLLDYLAGKPRAA